MTLLHLVCAKHKPSFNVGKIRRFFSKIRCIHLKVKHGRREVAIADAPKSVQLIVFQRFPSLDKETV